MLLSVALCFWLFAFAAHVHAGENHAAHGTAPGACTVCLSIPSGAPTSALLKFSATPATSEVTFKALERVVEAETPSCYLIRGPPAF